MKIRVVYASLYNKIYDEKMKKGVVLFTLFYHIIYLVGQQSYQKQVSFELLPANPIEKPGWRLTFNDEFDNPLLNDQYWYAAYRTGRIEYLKRIGTDGLFYNPNSLYRIEDGLLKLMIDETVPPRLKKIDAAVSCLMTSDHRFGKDATEYQVLEKFSQKYGWFEIRCKSIKGSGLYTAFWLHQTDPTDQEFTPQGERKKAGDGVVEIDIFEMLGKEAKSGNNYFNVHFPSEGGHYQYKMGFNPSEDFHIYAMEWKEGEINWYVDNQKVQTYNGETPQNRMFILLALFHGIHLGWVGDVSDDQSYPISFEVDYVRVYAKE